MQTLARALEQAPLDAVVLSNYARVLEESGGDAEQAIFPPPVLFPPLLLCKPLFNYEHVLHTSLNT